MMLYHRYLKKRPTQDDVFAQRAKRKRHLAERDAKLEAKANAVVAQKKRRKVEAKSKREKLEEEMDGNAGDMPAFGHGISGAAGMGHGAKHRGKH
eukprot:NODE_31124_length_403_cov_2.144928.p4 GENE.NODE_31124_length_403_cov_2.144928~~NODE_31124_length_403_cov_2.144928.p4  ORF type:complete len:95 (-),score=16.06 NODE_31124_length_403_cov_2.144928:38-322(-)